MKKNEISLSSQVDGTGKRYNSGKTQHGLIPSFAQEQFARVLTKGAEKYDRDNWRKGMSWIVVLDSMERHINAFKSGEDFDPETGILHTAHIMCNASFLTEYYKIYPKGDDRSTNYKITPKIGLDVDEVLCDWVGAWTRHFNMTVPKTWFFDRKIADRFDELERSGKLEEFYFNLEPLIDPESIPFEPHCYITSRRLKTEITESWLDKNGFPARPVYTVPPNTSKVDVILKSGCEIFVDDRFENFIEINNAGICCYLYDRDHNRRYDVGHKRIYALSDIITGDHLNKKYNETRP